jgi:hypothetical protein
LVPVVCPIYSTAIAAAALEMGSHAHGSPTTLGDAAALVLNTMWRLPLASEAAKEWRTASWVGAPYSDQRDASGKPQHRLPGGFHRAPSYKQCGRISMLPSRSSRALLSMHAFDSGRHLDRVHEPQGVA